MDVNTGNIVQTVSDRKNVYLVSVLTPLLNSHKFQEQVLAVDFCCPMNVINYQAFKNRVCKEELIQYSEVGSTENDASSYTSIEDLCPCIVHAVSNNFPMNMRLKLDLQQLSAIIYELKRSRRFRRNVLRKLFSVSFNYSVPLFKSSCSVCQRTMLSFHSIIRLYQPKKHILDHKWCKKLEVLANERCELENTMAWLSTLGGAFSSLGDQFADCAEKAGLISVQQFQLALRLGDPLTICRCKIYLAMSLLQRKYYRKTKKIIREQYEFSISFVGSQDFRLKNMCIAVWNRLKYELSEQKKPKKQI